MLSDDLTRALTRLAERPRVILASDFDGTLAPFVLDPMSARPIEGAMDALHDATQLPGLCVALVSGRDVETLRTLSGVAEQGPIILIGSHGAQSSRADLAPAALLDEDRRSLLAELNQSLQEVQQAHPQARIENKPAAVALHTRGLPEDAAAAALADAEAVADRPGVHLMRGKSVVELGVVDTSKGLALTRLAQCEDAPVLYFGDDVTDERAFEMLPSGDGHVTVKVGSGDSAAEYRVEQVQDVLACLRLFVAARASRCQR
ncbi:trehalose-phosphatase [Gephyromycinifex aptenodytis]|uniref:trehalose-phosphatase n=1 Tax=Gephyromycinifex aptenodytis TaxID=2716227 RepID=UPI0014456544|nr:trehalose-phosphatase [Gephyromycinifex aptenodytis]